MKKKKSNNIDKHTILEALLTMLPEKNCNIHLTPNGLAPEKE
jgi:hypothetical protein